MPPTPPPVYSPATLPTLQRATAGINTFVYRPAFRRAAYGNAGVVQRQRDPNPQKPKYKLSKFAVEIQQLIADHFNIPRKAFRLKEHCNSDFAVSSFTQEILYEQILDPSLSFDRDAFARENPDVELEQLYQAADSINGLTTEEVSGPIIHVRQDESFKRMQCTLIHEALHAYSHNAFKARYEKDMDEGMTELLALEIMAQYKGLTDTRSVMKVYTTEKRGAEALVRNYGVAAAQNAYFNGIFSATMPLNKAGLPVA